MHWGGILRLRMDVVGSLWECSAIAAVRLLLSWKGHRCLLVDDGMPRSSTLPA